MAIHMSEEETKGLGDYAEDLIKKLLPKTAERKKGCKGCKNRKIWLNNFGAKFG